jgi:hypothetical protein
MNQLNDLLAQAKISEQAWRTCRVSATETLEDKRIILHQRDRNWRALREEIEANVPVNFLDEDGEIDSIVTSGIMSSDLMLFYSIKSMPHDWRKAVTC